MTGSCGVLAGPNGIVLKSPISPGCPRGLDGIGSSIRLKRTGLWCPFSGIQSGHESTAPDTPF